jgi:HPt (histidine-containing phosphotransfer) domain-containing protein
MIYNLDKLKKNLGNDEKAFKDLLNVFLSTTPTQMKHLTEANQKQNFDQVRFIAHKLKTAFLTIGISDIGEILVQIQNACDENNTKLVQNLMTNLPEKVSVVLSNLAKQI